MIIRSALALGLILPLASCVTPTPEETNVATKALPSNHKLLIKSALLDFLYDPHSVKDAEISTPTAIYAGMGKFGPGVCVKLRGKNAYGAYIQRQTYAVAFNGGKASIRQPMYSECQNVTWNSFPEIEER